MTPEDVQAWLDAYIAAWRSYDPGEIANLFAENARYAYNPWDEPIKGADAIVAGWLTNPDEPDSWEAEYRPLLVSGNQAIAIGETHYMSGKVYTNLWPLTFDDGKCTDFVEWYMTKPAS
jgi:ketosteroid isomerase-like protein